MADAKEPGAKSGFMGTLVVVGIMILVPAVAALAMYTFVIKPMMSPEAHTEESAPSEALPKTLKTLEFEAEQATVLTTNPDEAAPILMFQVAVACNNEETAAVVEANKSWFQAKFLELHSNRTRQDLKDNFVKETIRRQCKQEANVLLERLTHGQEHEEKLEVLEVLHVKFNVIDL